MIKVDFHTHSSASRDGGIKPHQYKKILQAGILDCVAITDHNATELAQRLQGELGERIIVGEEIATAQGEIIGLFLSETIKPGQSALATAQRIKDQGGLVYIPHPFETLRAGISESALERIADLVDIVEAHNARAVFQNKGPQATVWATTHKKARAVASDAHGVKALGHTYCLIEKMPRSHSLVELLNNRARLVTKHPPMATLLYPKLNRAKKLITRR